MYIYVCMYCSYIGRTSLGTVREKAAMLSLSCSMLVAPMITDPETTEERKHLSCVLPDMEDD